MKILFLTNIPSPYRVHFFEELSGLCELTVLYEKKDASDRNDNWIQKDNKEKNYTEIYMNAVFSRSSSAFCPEVTAYLKKAEYDLIVVGVYSTLTGMYAITYMKMKKIPYVINCDGGIPGNTTSFKAKLKKFLIGGAEAWLSTGDLCDQYICAYGGKKEEIYQYPFTSLSEKDIQQKVPSREEKLLLKTELSIQENKIILSVGQFIYRKGYDILLEAANNMKDSYGIYIIGGKPTEEYLQIMKKYNLEHVHFMEFMDKQELQKYYLAADLFVLPTREDIWGLVINEAMAAGLPVITTTNCVAGVELIKNRKCLVPVNDSEVLSHTIINVMEKDDFREILAAENLLNIKDYTFENMAKRHIDIFEDIIRIRN